MTGRTSQARSGATRGQYISADISYGAVKKQWLKAKGAMLVGRDSTPEHTLDLHFIPRKQNNYLRTGKK